MKKSKKLFTALVAVVMTVVALTAAVTAVLSAQNQTVTSTLSVTYTANNVKATVTLKGKTQSGDWSAGTGSATTSFDVTEGITSKPVSMDAIALGGYVSSTFQRYAVYQFAFTNNYLASTGCSVYVAMTDTYDITGKNVYVAYQWSTSSSVPTVTLTATDTAVTSCGDDWSTIPPAKTAVTATSTAYIYMIVAISNVTLGINSYSNNGISFALTTT